MQQRKVPLRMCTGCSQHKPKRELVRVVKSPEGEISLDLTGKKSGRGAYLCNDLTCLQKARKQKRLEKAFSQQIPEEVYDKLEAQMMAGLSNPGETGKHSATTVAGPSQPGADSQKGT